MSKTPFLTIMKRLFDIVFSILSMIIFAIPMAVIWLTIVLGGSRKIIFRQERIGYKGRPFTLYKFRSMKVGSEEGSPSLFQSGDDDHRLTKIGRFLRKRHLDELPQLWNVFIGDMAFVGPRPERAYYIKLIEKEDPRYYMLYQIRPGVTSYATLYNGYTDTMEKMLIRLQYDLDYLEHRSWSLDMTILLKTFLYIVFGKNF